MKSKFLKSIASSPFVVPERGDEVTVVAPSGERIRGCVTECGPRTLRVTLMFLPATPLGPAALERLALEFTSSRGRVRLGGVVTLEDRDLLRFDELEPMEVIQQREYVRVPTSRPVTISSRTGQMSSSTYSIDISGGGLLLAGPASLKVGEEIDFRLTVAKGAPPIRGTGTVLRTTLQGHRAINFVDISEGDRRRLVRFVFECQRAERRRGLERGERRGR